MMKKLFAVFLLGFLAAGTALAQDFTLTGEIDMVSVEDGRVIVDDLPFQLSENLVVNTLSERNVSALRLRPGRLIGFKLGAGQVITEIWLLPSNYESRRGRR